MRTDGRTEGHRRDEANSRFSQFFERARKLVLPHMRGFNLKAWNL
jgi:hypothetical protein